MDNAHERITHELRKRGPLRSADLEACGIKRSQLARQLAAGNIARISRGLYSLPDRLASEHEALMVVAQRAPDTIFCLLTALRFHTLTTQAPSEVWVGMGNKHWAPNLDWPRLRVVRFRDALLETGIDVHVVDGTQLRVTSVARTVVDCFKFRNKIGIDVAIEALQDAVRDRRATIQEIYTCAAADRLANVIKPYLCAVA